MNGAILFHFPTMDHSCASLYVPSDQLYLLHT
jgi:hypothetical protein